VLAVVIAWVSAAVAGVIILGSCVYEIRWKASRLRADADRLERTIADLTVLQARLAATQRRVAATRPGS
jgi:hypothetical protein